MHRGCTRLVFHYIILRRAVAWWPSVSAECSAESSCASASLRQSTAKACSLRSSRRFTHIHAPVQTSRFQRQRVLCQFQCERLPLNNECECECWKLSQTRPRVADTFPR